MNALYEFVTHIPFFSGINTLYTLCALIGGIIMLVQFILMLIGIGDFDDLDIPDDAPSDLEVHADVDVTHGAVSLARYLSLRVVIAAAAFFGVIGLWANSAGMPPFVSFLTAMAGGLVAGFCVAFVMNLIASLQSEGNVQPENAIGKTATVYISIPEKKSNTGKIQLTLQGRIEELEAVTPGDALPSGTPVIVKEIINNNIAVVEKI